MVQKKIDETLKNIKSGIGKFIDHGWKDQNSDNHNRLAGYLLLQRTFSIVKVNVIKF